MQRSGTQHHKRRSHGSVSSISLRTSIDINIDNLAEQSAVVATHPTVIMEKPVGLDAASDHDSEAGHQTGHQISQSRDASAPVTWLSLPHKDQLAILFLCRFVDFLQVASLQTYVFYQLKHLNPEASDGLVSSQAGILQGAFTGAQVLTAVMWGKVADASWCGRKTVLVIGLFGTALSCLGYGFASSLCWAILWRAFGGAVNGLVGIIRTMISEITVEKKYQSRAFLILPISFNVANFLGPVMGGLFADPSDNLPGLFGPGSPLECEWINEYPYALPSILNAISLAVTGCVVFFCLEETSKARRGKRDFGRQVAEKIKAIVTRKPVRDGYSELGDWSSKCPPAWSDDDSNSSDSIMLSPIEESENQSLERKHRLPFSRIWTRNLCFTLIMEAFYDFHLGAFTNIWTLFLSTPRSDYIKLPFTFAGGMGMPASMVGGATSILGILGMLLQIFMYPSVHARLGILRSFRWFLLLFPIAYFLGPYLAVLPSTSAPLEPAAGTIVWIGLVLLLLIHTSARTMTLPASIILLNNCSPHPSVLGTVHGLGQSVSAGFRTVGPIIGGWWYGWSLDIGMVGVSWWLVAFMSAVGCVAAMFIYEGSGQEIWLEGEEDGAPKLE